MDTSRKANREKHEITLQYRSQPEARLLDELNEDRLTKLLAFVSSLKRTPDGTAELQRRIKLFGDCTQIEGETSDDFYRRLRYWLDRNIPQTKSPLHPPRQVGD